MQQIDTCMTCVDVNLNLGNKMVLISKKLDIV